MSRVFLPVNCFVCNTRLWRSIKQRNYRYVERFGKSFYLCNNCKCSSIKKKLVGGF